MRCSLEPRPAGIDVRLLRRPRDTYQIAGRLNAQGARRIPPGERIRRMFQRYPGRPYTRGGRYRDIKYGKRSLRLTCRRVWLEANNLPMLQAEHCFWYYRAAPDQRDPNWMAGLTSLNRTNFGQLHLFAQMFAIEPLTNNIGHLRNFFLKSSIPVKGDFQPRMLHITIR